MALWLPKAEELAREKGLTFIATGKVANEPRPTGKSAPRARTLLDLVDPAVLPEVERTLRVRPAAPRQGVVKPPQVAPPPLPPSRGRNPAPAAPSPAEGFIATPVDSDGIYTRLRRANATLPMQFELFNRGRWSDLDPDVAGAPGQGDGDVRAFLAHVAINKDEWESLSPAERQELRDSIRDLLVIERALSAVFDKTDQHFRKVARQFLARLAQGIRRSSKWPRGFQAAVKQRQKWATDRALFLLVKYLLEIVKKNFRPALIEEYSDAAKVKLARQANAIIAGQYGRSAARCTPSDLAELAARDAASVAKKIVKRIDPGIDVDGLERGHPRHRSRSKLKRDPRQ